MMKIRIEKYSSQRRKIWAFINPYYINHNQNYILVSLSNINLIRERFLSTLGNQSSSFSI